MVLATAVRRIAALAPGLALDIRSPPKNIVELFERGGIDLLVMPEQYAQQLNHSRERLFEDSHVCLVCADNHAVGSTLSLAEYMAQSHVAVRFGETLSLALEEWFLPRHDKPRRLECSVDNFATLPLLVMGTQRVATLHRRMAAHFSKHLPLRIVEPLFDMPPLVETLAWPRYLDGDPAHLWLRQVLRQCADELA